MASADSVASLIQGIREIKRERASSPPEVELENDLAAGFLRLAEETGDSYSLFFALERILEELRGHPQQNLLLFNRAVQRDSKRA